MNRRYSCQGFGEVYEIEAPNNSRAAYRAAEIYKKERGRLESLEFLKLFFSTRVLEPKKPGRKNIMTELQMTSNEVVI